MTIEEVGKTEEKIKDEEEKIKKEAEEKLYVELVKEFNTEAERISSPYRILVEYHHPHLYKLSPRKFLFWKYQEEEQLNQIIWVDFLQNPGEEYFVFHDGLDLKVFQEIEQILHKITFKFKVKIKDGKIPAKYGIIEQFENDKKI